jgi:hypothetical protein
MQAQIWTMQQNGKHSSMGFMVKDFCAPFASCFYTSAFRIWSMIRSRNQQIYTESTEDQYQLYDKFNISGHLSMAKYFMTGPVFAIYRQ